VTVKNNEYVPKNVTIKPGQTVEWVFTQGTHDVSSGPNTGGATPTCTADNKFQSDLKTTGTFRFKFDTAGTYPYFCTPHCGLGQTGTVVVAP
jgi:plastocyanin